MVDISIIVVARNEARYIEDCLNSIVSDLKSSDLSGEVLVVDGESTDTTVTLAERVLSSAGVSWRIFNNPRRTLATGWNIGIRNALGRFVVRPDAHAELSKGYIVNGIRVLREHPDVVAVGGSLETVAKSRSRRYFSYALSSKVGVGNSPFRTTCSSQFVDTAVYGVYRRQALLDVGGLDEKLLRHQDNDLHEKLRSKGWRFFQSGDMRATYYCRDTYTKISRQMYAIGRYLPDVWFGVNGKGIKLRHMAPMIFVILIILGVIVSCFDGFFVVGFFLPILYFIVLLADAALGVFRTKDLVRFRTVEVIPIMHFAYGFGTLHGVARFALQQLRNFFSAARS